MRFKLTVGTVLMMGLLSGCPLDEKKETDAGAESGEDGGAPDKGGEGQQKPSGGSEDAGTQASTQTSDDAGKPSDSEMDAGAQVEVDSSAPDMDAAQNTDTDAGSATADAGGTGNDAASVTGDASADAGSVQDSGPAIVPPDLGGASMADVDRAKLILNYLQTDAYATNWFPDLQTKAERRPLLLTPSHGDSVRVFQNAVAKQALDAWVKNGLPLPLKMPDGAVFVKEVYKLNAMTQNEDLQFTLVMAKINALDSTTYEDNWFFVKVPLTGDPTRQTTCINCHNGRTAVAAWPVNPNVTGDKGGKPDGVLPYDDLFIPFCYDPATPQCSGPN